MYVYVISGMRIQLTIVNWLISFPTDLFLKGLHLRRIYSRVMFVHDEIINNFVAMSLVYLLFTSLS